MSNKTFEKSKTDYKKFIENMDELAAQGPSSKKPEALLQEAQILKGLLEEDQTTRDLSPSEESEHQRMLQDVNDHIGELELQVANMDAKANAEEDEAEETSDAAAKSPQSSLLSISSAIPDPPPLGRMPSTPPLHLATQPATQVKKFSGPPIDEETIDAATKKHPDLFKEGSHAVNANGANVHYTVVNLTDAEYRADSKPAAGNTEAAVIKQMVLDQMVKYDALYGNDFQTGKIVPKLGGANAALVAQAYQALQDAGYKHQPQFESEKLKEDVMKLMSSPAHTMK